MPSTPRPTEGFTRLRATNARVASMVEELASALHINGAENIALSGDVALALHGVRLPVRTIELIVAPEDASSVDAALSDLGMRPAGPKADPLTIMAIDLAGSLQDPAFRLSYKRSDVPTPVVVAASTERVPSPEIGPNDLRADQGQWMDIDTEPVLVANLILPVVTLKEQCKRDITSRQRLQALAIAPAAYARRLATQDLTAANTSDYDGALRQVNARVRAIQVFDRSISL